MAVRGPQLDQEELLCDFHAIEQQVDGVIAPFHNANLNETAPFNQRNPTAEALFTVEAVQIAAGDLDCSLTGDPQLSAVSSYPFLASSAPNLAQGNTFTVTFGCDTSSTGNYTGNYICVAAGDGGAGIQVDLPVTCTVN